MTISVEENYYNKRCEFASWNLAFIKLRMYLDLVEQILLPEASPKHTIFMIV